MFITKLEDRRYWVREKVECTLVAKDDGVRKWLRLLCGLLPSCLSRPQDRPNLVAIPTVLLRLHNLHDAPQRIIETIRSFETSDDVFTRHFLSSCVVLHARPDASCLSHKKLRDVFRQAGDELGVSWDVSHFLYAKGADAALPPGPYFLRGDTLHQAWLLYPDNLDSFQEAVRPADSTESTPYDFSVSTVLSEDGFTKAVPVPSRLYSLGKPLAGARISIKDNIRLQGVKTSLECRSFYETYSADEQTAEYVKHLIDQGAVIIGKTKLCAFASAEDPPLHWIDYPCPFTPRGDGYQQPLGSTTGGATSLAGYDWMEYSIGTDTTGSTRAPAAYNGLWGIRTTTDMAASFSGIYRNCLAFDTVGLLARSAQSLEHLSKSSLSEKVQNTTSFPTKILYPSDFFSEKPHTDDYQEVVDDFVEILEKYLGVKKVEFSMTSAWDKSPPPEAEGKGLKEYLETAAYFPNVYDCYHQYDKFRDDHLDKFNKAPYVSPYMAEKWRLGSLVTPAEKEEGLQKMNVFRRWFSEHVMTGDETTVSSAVMILPLGRGEPWYRDVPVEVPYRGPGYSSMNLAHMLHLPQVVFPIGQFPYHSRITENIEYLPISTSLAGAPGSDLMLIKLAEAALQKASWPTEVKTGSLTFQLENKKSAADSLIDLGLS